LESDRIGGGDEWHGRCVSGLGAEAKRRCLLLRDIPVHANHIGECHACRQQTAASEGREKVFEDVKAEPGEKALVTFHTVAFEGSIGFVNMLQATRLQRKGFETSVLLYGPGVTLGLQRGFPTLGDEAFPGHLNFNKQLMKFMEEGGKVYACRFALQALYGHGEASLIEGIRPISPLDVLDIQLLHRKDNALIIHTWTV
jgi:uncharacterized repeat protein (TIGR04044 family)